MAQFIVKMGRVDGSAIKTLFFNRRKQAIDVANAVGFVFWGTHPFRRSDCKVSSRYELGEFWMEFIVEHVEAGPCHRDDDDDCTED